MPSTTNRTAQIKDELTFTKTALANKKNVANVLAKYNDKFVPEARGYYPGTGLAMLLLSAMRLNENDVCEIYSRGHATYHRFDLDKANAWLLSRVLPNTVSMDATEPDFRRLLAFSLANPYKMLSGETKATMSEKSQRTKQRDFMQIVSDTFLGKIGEIVFRKFAFEKFGQRINLDWDFSPNIAGYKTDLIGSNVIVSIKSSDTLESIWADAPSEANLAVWIRLAISKDYFLKLLATISSLTKLLNFVKTDLSEQDQDISDMADYIGGEARKTTLAITGFVCGYYRPSDVTLRHEGEELAYFGEVKGSKHLLRANELLHSVQDWEYFFSEAIPSR
jgi:hypothetical protein